jgi:hypothetical protein
MPIGVALPDDAMDEFTHGKPWSNTKLPPDQNEGHCIYLTGYTATGPTCITWGGYQALTWAWLTKYCDEAYFVLDDPANPKYNEVLDHDVLHAHLEGCRSANSFWRHNRFLWK